MVYYRKYRPQTIGELDSPKLQETLKAVLSGKHVPHAFLFTGPKGLGKTSTARIVAKVLNCKNLTVNGEPCNTCDQCVSITNGTNIDVLEIDGASNRGIDEIRELRERVKLSPSGASKKVYIIDEVHMLTTEAFNALLKTIEEPPIHAVFIFCTTQLNKVPDTILSRCFHVLFNLATEEELVHALKRVVTGEKITIDNESLHIIAKLAEGGFRDATKILEELVAKSSGKKITAELTEKELHVSGISQYISDLFTYLYLKKGKEAFTVLQKVSQEGIESKYFLTAIFEALHEMLLQNLGVNKQTNYSLKDIKFSVKDIQMLADIFNEASGQIKYAVLPLLPIEIAVIKWITLKPTSGANTGSSLSKVNSLGPTIDTLKKKEQSIKVKKILYPGESGNSLKNVDEKQTSQQSDISNAHQDEKEMLMENLLYKVKPLNATIAGLLRGCKITNLSATEIFLEASYKFHKERLEERKTYEIIEKAVREITGKKLAVKISLREVKK